MISPRHRWLAGAVLVALGWLASPGAVPVYDGIGAPDEPYRFVSRPDGAPVTADPTTATATTPVKDRVSTNGLSVATAESGPQFALYMPPKGMTAAGGPITITAEPKAPTTQPSGGRADGNVYQVSLSSPAGPVELVTQVSVVATMYLRATTTAQPPPVMYFRADDAGSWRALKTGRGGADIYTAPFQGPGQYVLAFGADAGDGGGVPVLPLVLVGVLLTLVVAVVAVRVRSAGQ